MKSVYYFGLKKIPWIFLVFVFAQCKKFVQIGAPSTELVTENVFNNSASATAAVTTIYAEMANNGESFNLALDLGMLSDELTNYNTSIGFTEFYTNSMSAAQSPGPWGNAYNYIFQANAAIAALKNNANITPAISQQLIGESEVIRAFWFFYLTNLYGDVPLTTSTDYSVNAEMSRTPRAQVYQQIIADLKDAESKLNINFVDATDTVITAERTRPTKWAAAALLARVYLYTNDFVDAESQASLVINNNSLFSLCSDPNAVFLANSTEAIWQLAIPLPTSYNTLDGEEFILLSAPGNGSNCCAISSQLLNNFEKNDLRRSDWIDSVQASTTTYYFAYKYKVSSASTVTEYDMVLRLAEQYLIRAEARAQQGNLGGAILDLNTIRGRANLPNYGGQIESDSILNSILHERRIELFAEWGNRWLDLIRTGNANAVMSIITPFKGGSWSTDGHQLLFPIPQSELTVDAALKQNSGY